MRPWLVWLGQGTLGGMANALSGPDYVLKAFLYFLITRPAQAISWRWRCSRSARVSVPTRPRDSSAQGCGHQ